MRGVFLSAGLFLALSGSAWAQPGEDIEGIPVKRLLLPPAKASVPALKYRLLPSLRDMKAGNAALLYQRAHSPEWFATLHRSADYEKMHDLLELPLAKLKGKSLFFVSSSMLREIDLAARRTQCDWELLDRIREDGFSLLIPDVQGFRTYGVLLSLRTREKLLSGDFDQAVHSLQTHLALARHVGEAPILINVLVANAISNLAMNDIQELVQVEGSPNLFWALADLPRPLISLRLALDGERIMFDVISPGMRDALKDPSRPPLTVEQINVGLKQLAYLGEGPTTKLTLAFLASRSYPKARQFLLEQGFKPEQIEEMPVLQVALMYAVVEYDRLYDEMVKWSNQPAWIARAGFKKSLDELKRARVDYDISSLPTMIIPAMEKVHASQVRLERRIALLQTVEAIRLYAAENEGKLPAALADIKDLPLPLDPATGEAFHYRLEGAKALLIAPPPAGLPATARTTERYEISVAPPRKK